MIHHFGERDAMRQNQGIVGPTSPEDKRKAAITVIQNVPADEREMMLDMLGLLS